MNIETEHELYEEVLELKRIIKRLDDRALLYEKSYREELIANHTLRQENEFLTKELEKYES